MNSFGQALSAYHEGDRDACFVIARDDGFTQAVPVKVFFETGSLPELESRALRLCQGEVLDIGSAAGRHSLALSQQGLAVWSLDILPEAQIILGERGLPHPVLGDALSWAERSFDTVLMLMNGIGLVGTPAGLDRFLRHAHRLVSPGGQILCDSIDVSKTEEPIHIAHHRRNREWGLYPGQQRFRIQYGEVWGEFFDWLHLDFDSLSRHGWAAGWECQLIDEEPEGRYLARMIAVDL